MRFSLSVIGVRGLACALLLVLAGPAHAQSDPTLGADSATVTNVTELYVAQFGRAPDTQGLQFWISKLQSGQIPNMVSLAEQMFATNAARVQFPDGISNQEIVRRFYQNTLGRNPDSGGLAFWTNKLDAANGDVGPVIKAMIDAVRGFDPANFDDPDVAAEGQKSKALFENKIAVSEYFAVEGPGDIPGAEVALDAVTANSDTSDDSAIEQVLAAAGALGGGGDSGGNGGDDNSGDVVGGGSAEACFNASLFAVGSQSIQDFRGTDTETGETFEFTSQQIVNGTVTFNGQTAIEVDGRVNSTDSATGASGNADVLSYHQVDEGRSTSVMLGSEATTAAAGFTSTTTTVNEPPFELRFNLQPGDQYTQRYTAVSTSDFGSDFGLPPNETRSEHERTITYLGREQVTVPAGTFEACKYVFEDAVTTQGQTTQVTTTQWFDVGTGVQVRTEETSTILELLSANVNGNSL